MRRLTIAACVSLILAVGVVANAQQSIYVWTRAMFGDGTAAAPSISFASNSANGLWAGPGNTVGVAVSGTTVAEFYADTTGLQLKSSYPIAWSGGNVNSASDAGLSRGAAGAINLTNGSAIGSRIKVDALPTAGTCGTSPAVTAGSTPFAGSVNVGTGGTATSCTVTFNGTAFPAAPFCTLGQSAGTFTTYTATTTVLTLSAASAWPASTVVSWVCPSSK